MHEGAIATSIIDQLLALLRNEGLVRVNRAQIKLGRLHQIVPESLLSFFDILKKEYAEIANCSLTIVEVAVQIRCQNCQEQSLLDDILFFCPRCYSQMVDIVEGQELLLERIEGEK